LARKLVKYYKTSARLESCEMEAIKMKRELNFLRKVTGYTVQP
jgi:hypothetical protein